LGSTATSAATSPAPTRVLDDFATLAPWNAGASDGVRASIHPAEGIDGGALRLDFDLAGTAGYALAGRDLALDLPDNYELSFYLRGDAPVNDFQVKLIDAGGENVWWVDRRDMSLPHDWREVRIRKREIEFAWGPTTDRTLRHAARIEFVVAAGRGGGAGSLEVSRLAIRELPPVPSIWPRPAVDASSYRPGGEPALALDGNPATAWESDPASGRAQALTLDFGRRREYGGIVVRWRDREFAQRYDVEASDDGVAWRTVKSVRDGDGGSDAIVLPDSESRFLRLALRDGPAAGYGVAEIEVEEPAFADSPNAFIAALARDAPRGRYPRGFSGEQAYWTIVGVDGGGVETGLLSSDGALEIGRGACSIEPFVVDGGKVVGWADVDAQPLLPDGYLPMPGVVWRRPDWTLQVSTFAAGTRQHAQLVARYQLANLTDRRLQLELVLAVRPFQVDPPSQTLNAAGGVSAIHDIAWDGEALTVNGERKLFALQHPARVAAFSSDPAAVPKRIAQAAWPTAANAHDTSGYASAALGYRFDLAPHEQRSVDVVVPLSGTTTPPAFGGPSPNWVEHERDAVAAAWREKLNRVVVRAPVAAQPLIDTLRSSLGWILVMRDGPRLTPGARSYRRSWIRDGAMIGESLLRLGHAGVAADFLRWYAPQQFAGGKVPCCVDARGADPVPEHDSAGELVFLAAAIDRYTHDRALASEMWPHVAAAIGYIDALRRSDRAGDGMLPASISHEGYSARPVHSYWDDFWALKGYDGAIELATTLDRSEDAARWRVTRDGFRQELARSLRDTAARHGIDYLAGSAELGDFDPASSAIAFAPRGDIAAVPRELIAPTFDRYWRQFVARRDGDAPWDAYTPYEIRIAGAFLRLAEPERAQALLAYFLSDRRPLAWNQWAEVVGRDPTRPRFIGDMPHGWVAADFIRAALDLFAYQRESDQATMIAAGIPASWLDGRGVAVERLATPYGSLGYTMRRNGTRLTLHIDAGSGTPPGGFVVGWPQHELPHRTLIDGQPASWSGHELHIGRAPATVLIDQ
ncbi:MAG TPA: discoidin domain-containing protein, partial [Casimicrobiaceae bacterium]|nr:discoidin domain-containing protein [Casimicrobiaceae bacterium]